MDMEELFSQVDEKRKVRMTYYSFKCYYSHSSYPIMHWAKMQVYILHMSPVHYKACFDHIQPQKGVFAHSTPTVLHTVSSDRWHSNNRNRLTCTFRVSVHFYDLLRFVWEPSAWTFPVSYIQPSRYTRLYICSHTIEGRYCVFFNLHSKLFLP